MKIGMKPSMVACMVTCMVAGLSVAGCQVGTVMGSGQMTPDAQLARQILAQSCEIGELHTGSGTFYSGVMHERVGKVDKRNTAYMFHYTLSIVPDRVYVHSLQDIEEGWIKADTSYEGNRDNLYFNKHSGEFACSIDEWRAVRDVPKNRHFEISPLIVSATPKTTAK